MLCCEGPKLKRDASFSTLFPAPPFHLLRCLFLLVSGFYYAAQTRLSCNLSEVEGQIEYEMATEVAEMPMELDNKKETLPDDSSEEEEPVIAKVSENGEESKKNGNGNLEVHSSADEAEESDKNKSETEEDIEDKPAERVEPVKVKAPVPKAKADPAPKKPRGPKAKATVVTRDFDASLVGALDTSLAEQVKSDGMRRERKQVQHFVMDTTPREPKAVVIAEGRGTKISEIPFVADQVNKTKTLELASLHRILFEKRGTATEIKKNIRQFSGFAFEEESSAHSKKRVQIAKLEMGALKQVCEVIGVLKKGTKEQVVDRILEFCMSPSDSGLKPGAGKSKGKSPRKTSKASPKRSSPSKGKSKPKAAASKGKKRKLDTDEEDGSDVDGDKSEEEEEEYSPRKRARDGPTRTASSGKSYQEVDDVEEDDDEAEVKHKAKSPVKGKGKAAPTASKSKAKPPPPVAEKPKIVYKDDLESDTPADADSSEDDKKKRKRVTKKKSPTKKKGASSKDKKAVEKEAVPVAAKEKKATKEKKAAPATNGTKAKAGSKKAGASKKFSAPPAKKAKKDESEEEPEKDKSESSEDEAGDDDLPSNEELKKTVVKIVEDSDLRKVTMKMIIEKVFSSYPDIDLEKKRNFIKGIVKEMV